MKTFLTLLFICSFTFAFGQNDYTKIDTITLQESYKKIRADGPLIPMDSTKKRSIIFRDQLKVILDKYDHKKGKNYLAVKDVYYKIQAIMILQYVVNNQYDSVIKYHQIIEEECTNQNTLGSANNYRSYAELDKNNTVEALKYIEKSIENFKLANNKDSEFRAIISLVKIHLKAANYTVAKELLDIFEKENEIENLSDFVKGELKIFSADVIAELDSAEKAILLLEKTDLTIFKSSRLQLSNYYILLAGLYIKTSKYNKALLTINDLKINDTRINSSLVFHRLSAKAYLGLKNYEKTLYHLKEQKKHFLEGQQINDIAYHKTYYKYHKAQGNYKKALDYFELAQAKQDSVNSKEYQLKASILNYKLKKESELIRLEERNKANDALLIKNKRFYTYSTLLISITVGTIIFFIMLYIKKKKTYRLKLENSKNAELAALKNRYIENISHEFRTPLTIIQGYIGLIRKNVFNTGNIIKYTDKTLKSTENIISELNDFLTILKFEKNEFISQISSKNLGTFLNDLLTSFEGITTLKDIKLYHKTNIKATKTIIPYDYNSIKKITNNLISNAIRFSNQSTSIHVKTILTEKELIISIKDEGIGIAKEDINNIFSRFYQSTENHTNGGFGIGLSLVQQLVENLKGKITVQSKKNVGSIFTVTLPLQVKEYSSQLKKHNVVYELINEEIESHDIQETNKKNKPKILLVDDDILIVYYLNELLKDDFDCTLTFNGADALKLAKETQFDLIVSDLYMPIMEGFELKKNLNNLKNYKDVPFLLISASSFDKKSASNVTLGVDDFIVKPFKPNELLTRIYNLLENKIYRNKLQQADANEKVEFYGHYADLMDKVNTIIHENIDNQDFSVDQLAKECNYSKRQLGRIIQAKTGLTPVKIILEIRLLKAYELLQKKEYQTIKEVVYAIGLNSVTYFNRAFTKRFGIKAKDLLK